MFTHGRTWPDSTRSRQTAALTSSRLAREVVLPSAEIFQLGAFRIEGEERLASPVGDTKCLFPPVGANEDAARE